MDWFFALVCAIQMLTPSQGMQAKLYIWGEVKSPGLYCVESNADILELISLAGGPTPDADLAHVVLIKGNAGGEEMVLNLGEYLSEQKSEEPIFLRSGDIVIIKSNLWKKVKSAASFISNIVVFVNLYLLMQKL
jgi:protein involved in polysaccharide export with SLBB domain